MRQIGTIAFLLVAVLATQGVRHDARGEEAGKAKAAGPTCDRAAFRLVLDVGHTAQVPGGTSARGVHEFDFNLPLTRKSSWAGGAASSSTRRRASTATISWSCSNIPTCPRFCWKRARSSIATKSC